MLSVEKKKEIITKATKLAEEIVENIPENEFDEFICIMQTMQNYLKIFEEIDDFGVIKKWKKELQQEIEKVKDEVNKLSNNTEKFDFIGYVYRELYYQRALKE
jgi:L-cystine uptake protein TcyP (sodium:dicarboxylate symporter family)